MGGLYEQFLGGQDKFDRRYRVTIYKPIKDQNKMTHEALREAEGDAFVIEYPITMTFSTARGLNMGMATANISLYNLSEATRNNFFHDYFDSTTYQRIQVAVGYGKNLSLIFDGRIMSSYSTHHGTEILTVISAQETYGLTQAISMNLPAGSTNINAMEEVIRRHVPIATIGQILIEPKEYERGVCFYGTPAYILHDLADKQEIFSLRIFSVIPPQVTIANNFIQVISPRTGLLESPRRYQAFLDVSLIMEPGIMLGQFIKLESGVDSRWNGSFKVMSVRHDGTISPNVGKQCVTRLQLVLGDEDYGKTKNTWSSSGS